MPRADERVTQVIHRFEHGGKRYAIDVETCFCFECDAISWDVLEFYPHTTPNRIVHLLRERHDPVEVGEVISELEWLRATNSIVPHVKPQDIPTIFTIERGLNDVVVVLPREEAAADRAQRRWFARHETAASSSTALELGRGALALLFARSGEQTELRFEVLLGAPADPVSVVETLGAEALRMATLAGKKLTFAVTRPVDGGYLGHGFALRLDFTAPDRIAESTQALLKAGNVPGKLVKAIPNDETVRGCAVLRLATPESAGAVRALHEAGFHDIELDLDAPYAMHPAPEPAAFHAGLAATATYYAECLLKNDYFRLEPMASLFARIYHGMPTRRTDPAGVQSLAVASDGAIWPSLAFITHAAGMPATEPENGHRLGNICTGDWDDARAARFADVGVTATSECMRCWARHLCGGGSALVHLALAKSIRTPHPEWCLAQRDWTAAAVSAFNVLSSHGVHFTRIYQSLNRRGRPGLFQLARTALKMSIVPRPLAEADAPMLREWENWNPASYFLLKQNGTLLATQYDREMDALYPFGNAQELLLTTRRGDPLGLVKLQPDKWPGVYRAWLYLHRESDYGAATVRNGFKELVKQVASTQDMRRLVFHAAEYESSLREFLIATGFQHEGTLREAVFRTSAYYDVHIHAAAIGSL